MKLHLALFCFSLSLQAAAVSAASCTHGYLFVSSMNSTEVFAMDLNAESLANLPVSMSIDLSTDIAVNELNLLSTASKEEVAIVYRGQVDQQYQDGVVRFVDVGVKVDDESSSSLSLVENAQIDCARAIHYVPHDGKIAIFCDGIVDEGITQINSTVWVVQEDLFGVDGTSAIVFQATLQGSHHGVAIPVDDDHVLYSLAQPERIQGNFSRDYALPDTFQVVDYEGNILHSIADTTNQDTSCLGFHGSWAVEDKNTFALACDDEHGGILVVDYTDSAIDGEPGSYTSRALAYPGEYMDHRTGSFAEHHLAPMVVGNFANGTHNHLMAFDVQDDALSSEQILALPARQCAYLFEQGEGQLMLVMMPEGELRVYQVSPQWKLVASATIVDGMQACSEAIFVAGVGQAFVLHKDSQMLHSVDLSHASDGDLEVYTTALPFVPFSAVVSGIPEETACMLSGEDLDHEEENHDEEDHADHDHSDHEEEHDDAEPESLKSGGSKMDALSQMMAGLVAVMLSTFVQ